MTLNTNEHHNVQRYSEAGLCIATLSLAHTTNTTLYVKKIGEHYLLSLTSVKHVKHYKGNVLLSGGGCICTTTSWLWLNLHLSTAEAITA